MLKRLLVGVSFLMLGSFGLQAQSSGMQSGSQSSSSQQRYDTQSSGAQSGSSQLSRTDQDFVKKTYESNLSEIELGQLATQKSSNSEVKQFARKMVDDHSAANDELKRIASSKGITLPSSSSSNEKNRFSSLSGSDFDQQYIQHQLQAHKDAVSMFRNEASNGQDPELKSFASDHLSKIENHEQMANSLHSRMSSSSTGSVSSRTGSEPGRSDYDNPNATSSADTSSSQDRPSSSSTSSSTTDNENLPRTASNMPLIGLVGFMLLTAALIMRSFRSLRNNR